MNKSFTQPTENAMDEFQLSRRQRKAYKRMRKHVMKKYKK